MEQKKNKILIVDDDPTNIFVLDTLLCRDYEIKAAVSGEEAIQMVGEFLPDLVLLDIMMPGMSGYQTCKKIKDNGRFNNIKVILVSAKAMVEERIEGYNVHADDYITKPFDHKEILAKIKVFLRVKNLEDELRVLNTSLEEQVALRTRQLVEAEKMATIGKYAAGIVHNLNNPLTAIMIWLDLLEEENPAIGSSAMDIIIKMKKAAETLKEIIKTILLTGRQNYAGEESDIDINDVIESELLLLKNNFFFSQVYLKTDLCALPKIRGCYVHFSQIFGNLLKNSVEAMHKTKIKSLTITSKQKDDTIVVSIADTGCGIAPENMEKIWSLFFTTKPIMSKDEPTGTGLGLASCRGMIQSYGGNIAIDSTVGQGTTMTVTIFVR